MHYSKYCNLELDLEKRQRNQRSNYQHLLDHIKSKGIPEKKTSISASMVTLNPLTVWMQQIVKNSSRDRITRAPYVPPEKSECRSRSNS